MFSLAFSFVFSTYLVVDVILVFEILFLAFLLYFKFLCGPSFLAFSSTQLSKLLQNAFRTYLLFSSFIATTLFSYANLLSFCTIMIQQLIFGFSSSFKNFLIGHNVTLLPPLFSFIGCNITLPVSYYSW
jgi:hypothetical protein